MSDITFNGKTQSISAWSRETGIPVGTISARINRLGQTPEQALTTPVDKRFKPKPVDPTGPAPPPPLKTDSRGAAYCRWTDPHTKERCFKSFGQAGKPATIAAYRQFVAEWYHTDATVGSTDGKRVSVAALIIRHMAHVTSYYTKHGKITSEVHKTRSALRKLNDMYGATIANEFKSKQLKMLQSEWVRQGLSIATCNAYLHVVKRLFEWGVSESLVESTVSLSLQSVRQLVPGRTTAAPAEKVTGVPLTQIEAMIPHLSPLPDRQRVLESLVRLQLASGLRPGEAIEICPAQIDRSRTPWLYIPASGGKGLHLDKQRRIFFGPRARAILAMLIEISEPQEPLFRFSGLRGKSFVPVQIGFYRQSMARACAAAGVSVIRPHQLRHTFATLVWQQYEDDKAVADALGNTPEVARQVYVDHAGDSVAARIAETLG